MQASPSIIMSAYSPMVYLYEKTVATKLATTEYVVICAGRLRTTGFSIVRLMCHLSEVSVGACQTLSIYQLVGICQTVSVFS